MKDSALEYSINRSTTKELKPLKPKHVQLITLSTAQRDIQMSEVFKTLSNRLRDSNWIVVFKSLILIHVMIREGSHERVLGFLASNPGLLDVSHLRDKSANVDQIRNVKAYAGFLDERVAGFKYLKDDFCKSKASIISKTKTDDFDEQKIKSIQCLQRQIDSLLECSTFYDEFSSSNVVALQSYRLIIGDMISLFHILNESVLRLLATYFELEKAVAYQALEIYKEFAEQTKKTTAFFTTANRLSSEIGLQVPIFKHAPASLATSLSDYLKAPNFEEQRLIYKERKAEAAKNEKKLKKSKSNLKKSSSSLNLASNEKVVSNDHENVVVEQVLKKNIIKADPVLVDFFASIDDQVNAYQTANTNQSANYDIGSFWAPQENSPSAHSDSSNIQYQQQLAQTEKMFANSFLGPNPAYPATLSQQSSFSSVTYQSTPPQNGQPTAAQVWNLNGNTHGGGAFQAFNSSPQQPGSAISAAATSNPFGAATQSNSSPFNPFAVTTVPSIANSTQNSKNNTFTIDNVFDSGDTQKKSHSTASSSWAPPKHSSLSAGFNAADVFSGMNTYEANPISSETNSQYNKNPSSNVFNGQNLKQTQATPVSTNGFNIQPQPAFNPSQNIFGSQVPSNSNASANVFNIQAPSAFNPSQPGFNSQPQSSTPQKTGFNSQVQSSTPQNVFNMQPQPPLNTGAQNLFNMQPQPPLNTGAQNLFNMQPQPPLNTGAQNLFNMQPQPPLNTGAQNLFNMQPQTAFNPSQNVLASQFQSSTPQNVFNMQPQFPSTQNGQIQGMNSFGTSTYTGGGTQMPFSGQGQAGGTYGLGNGSGSMQPAQMNPFGDLGALEGFGKTKGNSNIPFSSNFVVSSNTSTGKPNSGQQVQNNPFGQTPIQGNTFQQQASATNIFGAQHPFMNQTTSQK